MKKVEVKIVFPTGHLGGGDGDLLSTFLSSLAMKHAGDDEWAEKYGTNFENDVFVMHPYCWCEEPTCLWCAGCQCPAAGCEYYLDGNLLSAHGWDEANQQIIGELFGLHGRMTKPQRVEWEKRIAERDRRLLTVHLKRKHSCSPQGLMTDRESGLDWQPRQSAPNFWYKPSGFKVWWYKYIGRDMETFGEPSSDILELVSQEDVRKMADSVEDHQNSFREMLGRLK